MSTVTIPQGARCLNPTKTRRKFDKGNTWLWYQVKNNPEFPKPVYIGPKTPVFIEQQLDDFIAKCAERSVEA